MQPDKILVSDFDGTITKYDFYDLVCQEFPEIAGGFWDQYEKGEITHFEALRGIFAGLRTEESRLLQIVDSMQIDPRLSASVTKLANNGWSVVVASAGCDWYIRRLLKESGVSISVHANPGDFSSTEGLKMRLPEDSPFFSPELGVNKVAVVRDALKKSACVAFAGDGRPDLAPALLVPPQRRFAKNWLAKKLQEIGEDFQAFDTWSDVAEKLLQGE
ncbi:MAG: HAD-IB family phosphatase [Candidatus Omnitrophica bacterium]|nr:HAD-IB family phosphatase [Candidatus Omnitrophota bacterium]